MVDGREARVSIPGPAIRVAKAASRPFHPGVAALGLRGVPGESRPGGQFALERAPLAGKQSRLPPGHDCSSSAWPLDAAVVSGARMERIVAVLLLRGSSSRTGPTGPQRTGNLHVAVRRLRGWNGARPAFGSGLTRYVRRQSVVLGGTDSASTRTGAAASPRPAGVASKRSDAAGGARADGRVAGNRSLGSDLRRRSILR